MIDHIVLCRRNDGHDWLTMAHDVAGGWSVLSSGRQSLAALTEQIITSIKKHPDIPITFAARHADDVIAAPLVDDGSADGLKAAIPGANLTILLPEGRLGTPDMWAVVWRDPRGGLSSSGIKSRFRAPQTLGDQVKKFFEFEGHRKLERQIAQGLRIELWIRPMWCANQLIPSAFPTAVPAPAPSPEVTEAKARREEQRRRRDVAKRGASPPTAFGIDQTTGKTFAPDKAKFNEKTGRYNV